MTAPRRSSASTSPATSTSASGSFTPTRSPQRIITGSRLADRREFGHGLSVFPSTTPYLSKTSCVTTQQHQPATGPLFDRPHCDREGVGLAPATLQTELLMDSPKESFSPM
jgi:hypothetical protein